MQQFFVKLLAKVYINVVDYYGVHYSSIFQKTIDFNCRSSKSDFHNSNYGSEMKELYLKYISLVQDFENSHEAFEIRPVEFNLLMYISVAHYKNKPITISEAMCLRQIASPVSLHNMLDKLRQLDYVGSFFKGKNRKTKYLMPLEKADDLFQIRGNILLQTVSNKNELNTIDYTDFYAMAQKDIRSSIDI